MRDAAPLRWGADLTMMGMRMLSRVVVPAVALAAAAVLAGCTVDGSPQRGPVDLDLGKYGSMQAATLPSATTDGQWAKLRAVRLADHIVFPVDIDAGMTDIKMPTMPIVVPKNLGLVMSEMVDLPVMKRFQYGFSMAAGNGPNDFGVNHVVMRFADDRSAGDAVTQIGGVAAKPKDYYKPGGGRVDVAGMPPGSVVVHNVGSGNKHVFVAVAQSGPYVVYTWADSPDRAWGERAIVTAFDKQKSLLDAIGPENPDRNPDPTGLIRGTIRVPSDEQTVSTQIVFGQRGAALLYGNGPEAYSELKKAGITAAALNQTQAYRAAGPAQAEGWRDYLIKGFGDDTSRKAASPRDLSSAKCFQKDDRVGCFIAVGDYVGEAYGKELIDTQQQISAVYTFLKAM
ncbi:hypothetical protein WKY82_16015 [Gordonia malaquae]|uniref:DUF7373 family lipoprotein n=1 Tax=Gordonia malaquae TaxID=410332 RepID=UPI0030C79AF2